MAHCSVGLFDITLTVSSALFLKLYFLYSCALGHMFDQIPELDTHKENVAFSNRYFPFL